MNETIKSIRSGDRVTSTVVPTVVDRLNTLLFNELDNRLGEEVGGLPDVEHLTNGSLHGYHSEPA
jgi:hypothetical protein